MSRVVATSAAALFVALAVGMFAAWPRPAQLRVDRTQLPADGRATARITVERSSRWGVPWLSDRRARIEGAAAVGATVMIAHDGTMVVRAGTHAGVLEIGWEDAPTVVQRIELVLDPGDSDQDGLPDAMELLTREDQAAFSAWFTTIAEAQATRLDDAWAPVHQDCAGLVRFAFREALKSHDAAWLAKRRYLPAISAPDVRAVRYPHLPFAGDLPFREVGGAFDPAAPIAAQLGATATARTLWQLNTTLITRDIAEARPGDLLFFAVPHAPGSGLHTMIALGPRPGATLDDPVTRVVYHTGGDGEHGSGEVRVVSITDLSRHPDAGWHPVADNARFLGVHRLNHLHHEARSLARLGSMGAP